MKKLEALLSNGATGFIPSIEEICGYEARPPFLAVVELMDGTLLADDFPITPDLAVDHLVEICAHFLDWTCGASFWVSAQCRSELELKDARTPPQARYLERRLCLLPRFQSDSKESKQDLTARRCLLPVLQRVQGPLTTSTNSWQHQLS
ncbi:hypothetical protein PINS_up022789 [Pythium insidiosum]|nr:hypothetical protein PINS_up022789 [Pythium insidiosum]